VRHTESKSKRKVRIIAGKWRGRKLPVADIAALRPTSNRVRETLFNWLQPVINGAQCLDLYAGTGALGFEAASRGASSVVLVDHNPVLVDQLQQDVTLLDAAAVSIEKTDALQWLQHNNEKFDIVFLDPPFGKDLIEQSCKLLLRHDCLYPKAVIYIEAEKNSQAPPDFIVYKQGNAGQVQFMLIKPV